MVKPTLCHRQYFWMSKPYVPVVVFYSSFCRLTSLSDVQTCKIRCKPSETSVPGHPSQDGERSS